MMSSKKYLLSCLKETYVCISVFVCDNICWLINDEGKYLICNDFLLERQKKKNKTFKLQVNFLVALDVFL